MSEIAPWTRLFLISLALFVACKWLTYRRATHRLEGVTLPRLLSYWLLWPGMDADVARPFVFQPLARRVGPSRAAAATFLFSGLFHELTFSVPAAGGFG
ncbi:MAG TPA: hypothetical protein VJ783_08765, partial [Pirellulales bacterium]|nr:hypothetical protein [Pirellulales bacterium]